MRQSAPRPVAATGQAEPCRLSPKNLFKTPLASETVSRLAVQLGSFNLEKAVAVTRTPRAEPISLAETRRRGEFESYVKCSVKVRLHPIGEGNLLCGQSHKFQFHPGIHRNSSSPRLREMPSPWNCQVERSSRRTKLTLGHAGTIVLRGMCRYRLLQDAYYTAKDYIPRTWMRRDEE